MWLFKKIQPARSLKRELKKVITVAPLWYKNLRPSAATEQINTDTSRLEWGRTGEIRKQISNCTLGYSRMLANSGQEKDAEYFTGFEKNHKTDLKVWEVRMPTKT